MCRCLGLGILWQVTTAVTTRTLPIEPRVIHSRWRPRNESAGVTGVALNNRWNMATGLTEGIYRNKSAAVTGRTLTSRCTVIHLCRAERYKVGMACVAGRRCRYVIGRLAQARATRSMAIRANTAGRPIGVIKRCHRPGCR